MTEFDRTAAYPLHGWLYCDTGTVIGETVELKCDDSQSARALQLLAQ
jgi:Ser-tRNA(Ala) deacylase AlaX